MAFFGDDKAQSAFQEAVDRLRGGGVSVVEVDFEPYLEAARLLYEGPWVAERYAAVRSLIEATPEVMHPVTRQIIQGGIDRHR